MRSLKSLIPKFASSLGTTPATIYERQRALVRAGLLHARPGRGPGSGVPADAKSVAILLISLLATSALAEAEVQTKSLANLKSATGKCPVTGKRTFVAALTATLSSEEFLRRALYISARRSGAGAMASIVFLKDPIDEISFPPNLEDRRTSEFGDDLYKFYTENFAHLTLEATINIWGTLRGVELGRPK